ncbi:hypothetical protein QF036_002478 [Arthrobacter globiformis]|nr:hypothetical protein [Arthrobacter globiformis]
MGDTLMQHPTVGEDAGGEGQLGFAAVASGCRAAPPGLERDQAKSQWTVSRLTVGAAHLGRKQLSAAAQPETAARLQTFPEMACSVGLTSGCRTPQPDVGQEAVGVGFDSFSCDGGSRKLLDLSMTGTPWCKTPQRHAMAPTATMNSYRRKPSIHGRKGGERHGPQRRGQRLAVGHHRTACGHPAAQVPHRLCKSRRPPTEPPWISRSATYRPSRRNL